MLLYYLFELYVPDESLKDETGPCRTFEMRIYSKTRLLSVLLYGRTCSRIPGVVQPLA